MTIKTAANVKSLTADYMTGCASRNAVQGLQDSFADVMNKASGSSQKNSAVKETEKFSADSTKDEKRTVRENAQILEKMKEASRNRPEDVSEDAESAAEGIFDKASDILGISKEALEEIMASLGLTMMDLMNPDALTLLTMSAMGETDPVALLTNEELYGKLQLLLQNQQEQIADLAGQMGLSEEELSSLLEQALADKNAEVPSALQEAASEDMTQEPQAQEAVITITRDGKEVSAETETDNRTGIETITQEGKPLEEQAVKAPEGHEKQGHSEGKGKEEPAGNPMLQNLANKNPETIQAAQTEIPFAQTEQTQDIMRQIMDYMKINIKSDLSELEMQLHPSSLGTVNVHISAKDGIVTAQFTAQNELVKNAIESQLNVLQQNMNEQGLKIDAVEVAVAAHQFERNLDQGREQGETGQSQENKKKTVRKMNLSEPEFLEGENLDEDDRLNAEIMAQNGNSIDYMV